MQKVVPFNEVDGKSRRSRHNSETASKMLAVFYIFGIEIMYYTYIIYSKSRNNYYVGYTQNLKLRLERHNCGWSRSTKSGIPWEIVYEEEFSSKTEAIKREHEIKNRKSRKYLENLINAEGRPVQHS